MSIADCGAMVRPMVNFHAIAALLLIGAAAGADAQPTAELTVTYQWGNGTVAPQFHEVHRITIRSSGESEIAVRKGADAKESTASFTPDPAKLQKLLGYIRSSKLDSPPPKHFSDPPQQSRPGDGTCSVSFVVRETAYPVACYASGVSPLIDMIREMVPASLMQGPKIAPAHNLVLPMTFGGGIPDAEVVSLTLHENFTYDLGDRSESIRGTAPGSGLREKGRWSYDPAASLVTLHPEDPEAKGGSLTIVFSKQIIGKLVHPGVITTQLTAEPPSRSDPIPQGRPKISGPEPNEVGVREIAIRTIDGHFLTAASGGGYGGPDGGANAVALHSDAVQAGDWEHFDWIWLNPEHTTFALRTSKGMYITVVNGGGMGGPNDGRSPIHTDATGKGMDEIFLATFEKDGRVTLRTRKGFYITAVNGGGIGGPNTVPVHTDATTVGPWETFHCDMSVMRP